MKHRNMGVNWLKMTYKLEKKELEPLKNSVCVVKGTTFFNYYKSWFFERYSAQPDKAVNLRINANDRLILVIMLSCFSPLFERIVKLEENYLLRMVVYLRKESSDHGTRWFLRIPSCFFFYTSKSDNYYNSSK